MGRLSRHDRGISPLLSHLTPLSPLTQLTASKMLYDDGEQEQVFNDEWAASAEMTVDELNAAEIDFLNAMVSGWRVGCCGYSAFGSGWFVTHWNLE